MYSTKLQKLSQTREDSFRQPNLLGFAAKPCCKQQHYPEYGWRTTWSYSTEKCQSRSTFSCGGLLINNSLCPHLCKSRWCQPTRYWQSTLTLSWCFLASKIIFSSQWFHPPQGLKFWWHSNKDNSFGPLRRNSYRCKLTRWLYWRQNAGLCKIKVATKRSPAQRTC